MARGYGAVSFSGFSEKITTSHNRIKKNLVIFFFFQVVIFCDYLRFLNPPYVTQFLSLHHPLQPESILLLLLFILFFYIDKVTKHERLRSIL